MREAAPHIVARYSLELDFQEREGANRVAEELLAVSRGHVAALLEECCSQWVPQDQFITIPLLEIDLGELDGWNLSENFLEKFKAQLGQQLSVALSRHGIESLVQRALQLIQNYGATGQYPWWADSPAPERLHLAIQALVEARDVQAHHQLRALLQQGETLRRLILALPEHLLSAIWECMFALGPPILAQAAIEATTRGILKQFSFLDRHQWLEFAYRSIQRSLNATAQGASPQRFLEWMMTEGEPILAPEMIDRFGRNDEFSAVILWCWEVLSAPASALRKLMVGLFATSRLGEAVQQEWVTTSQEFRDWLHRAWKLDAAAIQRFMKGIVTNFQLWQSHPEPKSINWEGMVAWLRVFLEMPNSSVVALVSGLLERFKSADPTARPSVNAVEAWLKLPFTLSSEARTAFDSALQTAESKTTLRPITPASPEWERHLPLLRRILDLPQASPKELLAKLWLRFSEENPQTQADLPALLRWLRVEIDLSEAVAANIAAVMLAESALAVHANPEKGLSPEFIALLPLLRRALDLPQASPKELLAKLWLRFSEENPQTQADLSALTRWLRVEINLVEAVAAKIAAMMLAESAFAVHADPEKSLSPEMTALLPLLRRILDKPNASLEIVLETLLDQFEVENPDQAATEFVLESWLGARHPLPESAYRPLAKALTKAAEGRPHPQAQPNDAPQLVAILPLLRHALDMPQAKPAELFSTLLAQFHSENPSSEANSAALESWLRNAYSLPAEARATLVNLLEAAAKTSPRRPQSPAPDLPSLTAWLRETLQLPHHALPELLVALSALFRQENSAAEDNLASLERWLNRKFDLSPEARWALVAAFQASASQALDPNIVKSIESPSEGGLRRSTAPQAGSSSIWIENAGLVLFWPFLQRFFQYLGLVQDKAFVSVLAQEQAVRLLQMMVMPHGEWNEAALALPKILCGLPPDAVVDPQVALDPAMAESDAVLIEVALSHWTMVGQLSADGFRQAWLARNGSLRIRDDHWLLRVETMAHDVLMEGMPWEIAYVSLPWMRDVMYVDWGEKAKFNQ